MDTPERRTAIYEQLETIRNSKLLQLKLLCHMFRDDHTFNFLNWYRRELNYLNINWLEEASWLHVNRWNTRRHDNVMKIYLAGVTDDAMHDCMLAIDDLITQVVHRWGLIAKALMFYLL